jgi:hypothetical protein
MTSVALKRRSGSIMIREGEALPLDLHAVFVIITTILKAHFQTKRLKMMEYRVACQA